MNGIGPRIQSGLSGQFVPTNWYDNQPIVLARVIAVDSSTRSIDVADQNGAIFRNVKVATYLAGTREGSAYLPKVTNPPNTEDSKVGPVTDMRPSKDRDTWAIIAFAQGDGRQAVCIGFLFPPQFEASFADSLGVEVSQKQNGMYTNWTADGVELSRPDGTYIKFGTGAAKTNLNALNRDAKVLPFDDTKGTATGTPDITIAHSSGSKVSLASAGDIAMTTPTAVTVTDPTGTFTLTNGALYAPKTATYLTTTSDATLTAEVVVGTTPGGELAGTSTTWAAPTVRATHSGSAHHNQSHGNTDHTTGVAPADVTKAAAAEGTSASVARADHKHDASTATAGASTFADTAAEGTATSIARSDHRHSRETFSSAAFDATVPTTIQYGDVAAVGAAAVSARRDHLHGAPSATQPNLVINSDFGRRTVLGLSMVEVFADTSAWSSTSTISVASNQLTIVTANRNAKWIGPNTMWADGRWSAQFKYITTNGVWILAKDVDSGDGKITGNDVQIRFTGGNIFLDKIISGARTQIASVAVTAVLNNWYWLELEAQGTTYIAKIYNSGASAATKISATLLQTLSGTATDTVVASGMISLWSDQANSVWGGLAASPGGAYVETTTPESNTLSAAGTLGGQAWGFDESVDAGPIGKQWALRLYVPAASRIVQGLPTYTKTIQVVPSTAYTFSGYVKVSGLGGSGVLVRLVVDWLDSAGALVTSTLLTDAGETSWTRKTTTVTSSASAKYAVIYVQGNPSSTATGTGYAMCLQLEQGSTTTAWRNAPADDAPLVWRFMRGASDISTASTSYIEADPRDLAGNLFLPWDGRFVMTFSGNGYHNTLGSFFQLAFRIDGSAQASLLNVSAFATGSTNLHNLGFTTQNDNVTITAGKHRVALLLATNSGTVTINSLFYWQMMTITAYRGR